MADAPPILGGIGAVHGVPRERLERDTAGPVTSCGRLASCLLKLYLLPRNDPDATLAGEGGGPGLFNPSCPARQQQAAVDIPAATWSAELTLQGTEVSNVEAGRFSVNQFVPLGELVEAARHAPAAQVPVRAVSCDSRAVRPGDVFFAISGLRVDGHRYIPDAVRKGACAVVAERYIAVEGVPTVIVPCTRREFARACMALVADKLRELRVIGVTGTNGKSTTAWLIHAILEQAEGRAGLIGTILWRTGEISSAAPMTTPGPAELAQLMFRARQQGCRSVVMEVSSHALALHRCEGMGFVAAAYLGLSRDHLDFHGSMERYAQAKRRLFELLLPRGLAAAPVTDEWAATVVGPALRRCLWFGFAPRAHVSARILRAGLEGTKFEVSAPWWRGICHLSLPGQHNVLNALAAAAVLGGLGLEFDTVRRGIATVKRVPGRLERVPAFPDLHVFVDYAHTPDALRAVLTALRQCMHGGRLIVVFGAGGDRDRGKRPLMGRVATELADLVVLTDDNPRTEEPEQIVAEIRSGCLPGRPVIVERDRAAAIETALDCAEAGDVVVIAGKGHEQYQVIGNERVPFDDREVVHAWVRRYRGSREWPARRTA